MCDEVMIILHILTAALRLQMDSRFHGKDTQRVLQWAHDSHIWFSLAIMNFAKYIVNQK